MRLIKRNIQNIKIFLISFLLLFSQAVAPLLLLVSPVQAGVVTPSTTSLTVGTHQGQLDPSGDYSSGDITTYSELDEINFRLTLTATEAANGNFEVRFTGNDTGGQPCLFFEQSFVLGAVDNVSGVTPGVSLAGTPTVDGNEWIQVLNVNASAAGSGIVNYTLQLSGDAGACGGSSQYSRLGNADTPGNFGNIDAQNIPVPAQDIEVLPDVIIHKSVDTDGDGSNDRSAFANEWSFSLDGQTAISLANPITGLVFEDLTPGVHTIEEIGPAGFEFYGSGGSCSNQVDDGVWTFEVTPTTDTADLTCNFWNQADDDQVTTTLELVKEVKGGEATATDWILKATPANDQYPELSGQGGVDATEVPADVAYVLSESDGPQNYVPSNWECSAGELDNDGVTLTLSEGDHAVCTIINTYQAPPLGTVTVNKIVTNNDGGTAEVDDFDLFVGDTQVTSGEANQFSPGTYEITETPVEGYRNTSLKCEDVNGGERLSNPFTLTEDQSVVCTVKNNDKAPYIKIFKRVINDNDGNAESGDFTFYIDDREVELGKRIRVKAGLREVSEDVLPGYEQLSIRCWDNTTGAPVANPVNIQLGQYVKCLITNNDVPPNPGTITVTKAVVNDDGGNAKIGDFLLQVNKTIVSSGVSISFDPGVYDITETPLVDGYENTKLECLTEGNDEPLKLPFTLEAGQKVACEVVNDDIPATITVIKKVKNDDGGDAKPGDFKLFVNRKRVRTGRTFDVDGNTRYRISERLLPGYEQRGIFCFDQTSQRRLTNPFIADLGHEITCFVINDDIAPTIEVVKKVINDDGGDLRSRDFTLTINGRDAPQRKALKVDANKEYIVSEEQRSGYELLRIVCRDKDSGERLQQPLVLELGQDVKCRVINDDIPPTVTVVKNTVPYESTQAFEFSVGNLPGEATEQFSLDTDMSNLTGDLLSNKYLVTEIKAGTVQVTETPVEGWLNGAQVVCFNNKQPSDDIRALDLRGLPLVFERNATDVNFPIEVGQNVICIFTNVEKGDVNVTKYYDKNENGIFDPGETTLEGWEMTLESSLNDYVDTELQPQTIVNQDIAGVTGEDGTILFEDVKPGPYQLTETQQEGWRQTGAVNCDYGSNGEDTILNTSLFPGIKPLPPIMEGNVMVIPGETVECYIGNTYEPVLEIAKVNDQPEPAVTGDSVTYTITVTVPEESGCVYRQTGFMFESTLSEQLSTQEDTEYELFRSCASIVGVVVPVTAQDEISVSGAEVMVTDLPPEGFEYVPGSWTAFSSVRGDLKGLGITTEPTYASPGQWNLTNPGSPFLVPGEVVTLTYVAVIDTAVTNGDYPDTAFVEGYTNNDMQKIYGNLHFTGDNPFVGSQVAVASVDVAEQGYVLGTRTLQVTGVPAILAPIFGAILAGGALLVVSNRKRRRFFRGFSKSLASLALALVLSISMFSSVFASGFWTTNISTPEAFTTNGAVNIDYQVTSTEVLDTFDVSLLQDGSPILMQSVTTPYGDSGRFPITLTTEGSYTFQTSVLDNNGSETKLSNEVTVVFDKTAPTAPIYGGVTRSGDTYTVSFTAPTGDVSLINVYASTTTSFDLDASTKVGQVSVLPGGVGQFTYSASDSTQRYFAITAEDAAGNQSPAVGDETVTTTVVTATPGDTTNLSSDASASAAQGTVGDEAAQSGTGLEGVSDIASAEQIVDDASLVTAKNFVILLVVLGAVYLVTNRIRKTS